MPPSKDPRDLITRGSYDRTPFGKAVFIGLRALDPFLQYGILAHGVGNTLIRTLGGTLLPPGAAATTGIALIDSLNLSPQRLALLAMSIGTMLKQNHWVTFLSNDPLDVGAALQVGVFNSVFNSLNSLLYICAETSPSGPASFPRLPLAVGSAFYVTGLFLEWASELQRKKFKSDPKNKGKPYTGGLWKLARHINYGGYTLWRAGYAVVGGGWVLGAGLASFFLWDFSNRAVPILDSYCTKNYGEAWVAFKAQVPYKLLPWIL